MICKQVDEGWVGETFIPGQEVLGVEIVPFLGVLGIVDEEVGAETFAGVGWAVGFGHVVFCVCVSRDCWVIGGSRGWWGS